MIRKIERPDWLENGMVRDRDFLNNLNNWFDTHVQPVNDAIEKAVEVIGYKTEYIDVENGYTFMEPHVCGTASKDIKQYPLKAVLMGIEEREPKRETPADIAKKMVEELDDAPFKDYEDLGEIISNYIGRFKRALEND